MPSASAGELDKITGFVIASVPFSHVSCDKSRNGTLYFDIGLPVVPWPYNEIRLFPVTGKMETRSGIYAIGKGRTLRILEVIDSGVVEVHDLIREDSNATS